MQFLCFVASIILIIREPALNEESRHLQGNLTEVGSWLRANVFLLRERFGAAVEATKARRRELSRGCWCKYSGPSGKWEGFQNWNLDFVRARVSVCCMFRTSVGETFGDCSETVRIIIRTDLLPRDSRRRKIVTSLSQPALVSQKAPGSCTTPSTSWKDGRSDNFCLVSRIAAAVLAGNNIFCPRKVRG